MSIAAISCDETVDFDELYNGNRRDRVASSKLRNAICSEENQFRSCNKSVTLQLPENSWKVEMVANNRCNVKAEAGVDFQWGGKNGVEMDAYLQGKVEDSHGNYGEIQIERKSDGTGGGHAAAGCYKQFGKDSK